MLENLGKIEPKTIIVYQRELPVCLVLERISGLLETTIVTHNCSVENAISYEEIFNKKDLVNEKYVLYDSLISFIRLIQDPRLYDNAIILASWKDFAFIEEEELKSFLDYSVLSVDFGERTENTMLVNFYHDIVGGINRRRNQLEEKQKLLLNNIILDDEMQIVITDKVKELASILDELGISYDFLNGSFSQEKEPKNASRVLITNNCYIGGITHISQVHLFYPCKNVYLTVVELLTHLHEYTNVGFFRRAVLNLYLPSSERELAKEILKKIEKTDMLYLKFLNS